MIRKHKIYSRPRKPFDGPRIKEENEIRTKFGLKNKKEIWKAEAAVGKIRREAKKLTTSSVEKQEKFLETLKRRGLKVNSIAEALGLTKDNWMNRRLQTIVSSKFNIPMKKARQMITHKKVMIHGETVNIPSYVVFSDDEDEIKLVGTYKKEKPIKAEVVEEIANE